MQVPLSQPLLWPQMQMAPPTEQYITAQTPSHGMVFPQPLGQETLVSVPIMLKNGWVVPGIPQPNPHPAAAYVSTPVQYVAVQTRFNVESGGAEKQLTAEQFVTRPILIPRGPASRGNHVSVCGRSLRGNNYATRRPSEENCDDTPVKKLSFDTRTSLKKEVGTYKDRDDYILQSIEYYFSDENLSKNAYLLKQVLQEDGYISLKRVAALKRVKLYTRDDQVVAQCIRRSEKLELNENGTMVRRKDPLPANIEPPRFVRSVIAINLPMEIPTIESVTSLFATYGDLTQVRIIKPGKKLPSYLMDYQGWIPDLGKKYCALVEFESQDEAQNACREINMKNRSNESLRVALLKPGARLRRTLYRKYKGFKNCQATFSGTEFEKSNLKPKYPDVSSQEYDASCSGSGSESEIGSRDEKYRNHPTEKASGSDSGCCPSNDEDISAGITYNTKQNDCTQHCDFKSITSFTSHSITTSEAYIGSVNSTF